MKQAFVRYFNNLSFQKKVIILCLIISLIPIILIGSLTFSMIRNDIVDREMDTLSNMLQQESANLENRLAICENAMDLILYSDDLKLGLTQEYESNYDLYIFYKYTLDPLFLNITSINTDISMVTIYTDADIHSHGNYVHSLKEAQKYSWYEQALESIISFYSLSDDGETLYLVCRLNYRHAAPTSIVCISIPVKTLFSSVSGTATGSYGFLMTDSKGNVIYQAADYSSGAFAQEITPSMIMENTADSCIVLSQSIDSSNWIVYLYRSYHDLNTAVRQFALQASIIVLLSVLFSWLSAYGLAKAVVAPLQKLAANMTAVEQGHYEVTIPDTDRKDEIGQLLTSFRYMIKELNHLINETLLAKIRQQKYELEILQSQINPHFLYNSLSLINNRAVITGQNDISQMAQLLSTFYRTMLNKGKNLITVAAELDNVRAYISIQQMMHADSFDVIYEIDERANACCIPNLILQPLAENSILHGLDQRQAPGRGTLSISCKIDGNDLIFQVMDNGCGMSEEDCREILTIESHSYGVKNVHQRIQLYYGENYGLTYRSTLGFGTCAILRVRKEL